MFFESFVRNGAQNLMCAIFDLKIICAGNNDSLPIYLVLQQKKTNENPEKICRLKI